MATSKITIDGVTEMDVTQNTVNDTNLLSPNTATKNDGTSVTGGIVTRSKSNLTASGATVTVPGGYYPTQVSKSISNSYSNVFLDYPDQFWTYEGTTDANGTAFARDYDHTGAVPSYDKFTEGSYYTITINGVSESIQAVAKYTESISFTSTTGWTAQFYVDDTGHESFSAWVLNYYTSSTAYTFSIKPTYGTLVQPRSDTITAGYVNTGYQDGSIYQIPGGKVTVTRTLQPKNLLVNGDFSAYDYHWNHHSKYIYSYSASGIKISVRTTDTSVTTTSLYANYFDNYITGTTAEANQKLYFQGRAYVSSSSQTPGYPSIWIRRNTAGTSTGSWYSLPEINGITTTNLNDAHWHVFSAIYDTYSSDTAYEFTGMGIGISPTSTENNAAIFRELLCVNLTETYGAGNEPDKAWCDENLNFKNTHGGVLEEIDCDSNTGVTYNTVGYTHHTLTNLLTNGSLAYSTDGWTVASTLDITQHDGYITLTVNDTVDPTATDINSINQTFTTISGGTAATKQIIYYQCKIRANAGNTSYPRVFAWCNKDGDTSVTTVFNLSPTDGNNIGMEQNIKTWTTMSSYRTTYDGTSTYDYTRIAVGPMPTNTEGEWIDAKDFILVNLTAEYGAGNEPDKAWCDQHIRMEGGIITDDPLPSNIILNNNSQLDVSTNNTFTDNVFSRTTLTNSEGLPTIGAVSPAYKFITKAEFTVSTTSTTATSIGTIALGSSYFTSNKILYVKIRDKAGPRAGYFVGTDSYFFNFNAASSSTTTVTAKAILTHRQASGGAFTTYVSASGTVGYGVYPYSIDSSGNLLIYRRYSSTYTPTVNGTYLVEVYTLDYVGTGGNPFSYSAIS